MLYLNTVRAISPADKNNIMKSTIKIDYRSSSLGGTPLIKIIRPSEVVDLKEFTDGDYDVRDKLVNDFIQSPDKSQPHDLFVVETYGCLEKSPEHHIVTIKPLQIEDQFNCFKYKILSRIVPYKSLAYLEAGGEKHEDAANYKKIIEFFDWLNKQDWATYEEQYPQ